MKTKITAIFASLLLYSCGFGKSDWSLEKLYVQKIEGTSKVIYNFSAWGGLDSNPQGFIVLDSASSFEVDIEKILPILDLSNIPTKDKIEGVSHSCFGTCGDTYSTSTPVYRPMKTEETKSDGLKVINQIYQYRGYSEHERGLERYVFENFTESNDSLIFYQLEDIESSDGIKLEEMKVKKGGVYLDLNENGEVVKIIIKQKSLSENSKEFIQGRTCFLTPKYKTRQKDFSERGIFREIITRK